MGSTGEPEAVISTEHSAEHINADDHVNEHDADNSSTEIRSAAAADNADVHKRSPAEQLDYIKKELNKIREQDIQLLRQLLHINHTINLLTGSRNPYQRSHSSSSMSQHWQTRSLLHHPSYSTPVVSPPASPCSSSSRSPASSGPISPVSSGAMSSSSAPHTALSSSPDSDPCSSAGPHTTSTTSSSHRAPRNSSHLSVPITMFPHPRQHLPLVRTPSEPVRDVSPVSPVSTNVAPTPWMKWDISGEKLANSFGSFTYKSQPSPASSFIPTKVSVSPSTPRCQTSENNTNEEPRDVKLPTACTDDDKAKQQKQEEELLNRKPPLPKNKPPVPPKKPGLLAACKHRKMCENNKTMSHEKREMSAQNVPQNATGDDAYRENKCRPPLQHMNAVCSDEDVFSDATHDRSSNYGSTTHNATAQHITTSVNIARAQHAENIATHNSTVPAQHNTVHLAQYEMSYEQFLMKGIQLWKDVERQQAQNGSVDERKMAALTIVM